jgi:hypothetical protein
MSVRQGRGRPPSVWRSELGMKFVEAVALAKYHHSEPITTGRAIRIVLRQPEFAPLRRYANGSTRYMQKQLVEIAEFFRMHPTFRELIGRGRIYWNTKLTPTPSDHLFQVLLIAYLLQQGIEPTGGDLVGITRARIEPTA